MGLLWYYNNKNKDKDFIKKILNYKKSNKKHKEFLVENLFQEKNLLFQHCNLKKIKSLAVTEIKLIILLIIKKVFKGYTKHILPAKLSKKL